MKREVTRWSRRTRMWSAIIVLGIVLGMSALALATGGGAGGPTARGITVAPSGSLTDTQLRELEGIRSDLERKTQPLERQVEAEREKLDAMMTSSNPDLSRARSLRSKIRQLESQLDDAWFDASEKVSKILTPEQRAQGAAPSAWLVGNGGWYNGWSCPWDRDMDCNWYHGGHGHSARNWRGYDTSGRWSGSGRWGHDRMAGGTGCCF